MYITITTTDIIITIILVNSDITFSPSTALLCLCTHQHLCLCRNVFEFLFLCFKGFVTLSLLFFLFYYLVACLFVS